MVNDVQNINRANAILRRIQRILCKNKPNGWTDPDAEENDDNNIFIDSKVRVNPKDVAKEMANLLELFTELREVVETIENIEIKIGFNDIINNLENVRLDIRDKNQDIVNDQVRAEDRPFAIKNTFLIIKGGDSSVFKDWT